MTRSAIDTAVPIWDQIVVGKRDQLPDNAATARSTRNPTEAKPWQCSMFRPQLTGSESP
jgi:hypothetical protein